MKSFEEELEIIFTKSEDRFDNSSRDSDNEPLKSDVYRIFEDASGYINKRSESQLINTIKIPRNLNSLLFNFESGSGFLVTFGRSKLVMVLFEEESFVTFVGRLSDRKDKNIKLLRLSVESKEDGTFLFRDNSGVAVEMREVALQVINWGLS